MLTIKTVSEASYYPSSQQKGNISPRICHISREALAQTSGHRWGGLILARCRAAGPRRSLAAYLSSANEKLKRLLNLAWCAAHTHANLCSRGCRALMPLIMPEVARLEQCRREVGGKGGLGGAKGLLQHLRPGAGRAEPS